jgi:hypothetical protein
MYLEQMPAGDKWCWFLHLMGAPPPKSGIADTLDEAKAEIAACGTDGRTLTPAKP